MPTPVCKFQRNFLEYSQTCIQLLTALSRATRVLSFLSNSTVDVDLEIPLHLEQTEPGQISFSVKSCRVVFIGIQVNTGQVQTQEIWAPPRAWHGMVPCMKQLSGSVESDQDAIKLCHQCFNALLPVKLLSQGAWNSKQKRTPVGQKYRPPWQHLPVEKFGCSCFQALVGRSWVGTLPHCFSCWAAVCRGVCDL